MTRSSQQNAIDYQRILDKKILAMTMSAEYWAKTQYNQNAYFNRSPKNIATKLNALEATWHTAFTNLGLRVVPKFVSVVEKHATSYLNRTLAKGKIPTVNFQMTQEMRDAVEGIIETNVNLIKSIPQHYFTQVKTITLESVTRGRDLRYMTDELQKQTGITRRRAIFIAQDQNNKASAELSRIRQRSIGITKGIWIHSGGGSNPRKSHVAASGTGFELDKGLPLGENGEYILPGTIYNCRCQWRPLSPYD